MSTLIENAKRTARKKMISIILFIYALVLGTSLPLALSRCTASCLNCGSCTLYLGIIPIILAVALRRRIKKAWTKYTAIFFRKNSKGL